MQTPPTLVKICPSMVRLLPRASNTTIPASCCKIFRVRTLSSAFTTGFHSTQASVHHFSSPASVDVYICIEPPQRNSMGLRVVDLPRRRKVDTHLTWIPVDTSTGFTTFARTKAQNLLFSIALRPHTIHTRIHSSHYKLKQSSSTWVFKHPAYAICEQPCYIHYNTYTIAKVQQQNKEQQNPTTTEKKELRSTKSTAKEHNSKNTTKTKSMARSSVP